MNKRGHATNVRNKPMLKNRRTVVSFYKRQYWLTFGDCILHFIEPKWFKISVFLCVQAIDQHLNGALSFLGVIKQNFKRRKGPNHAFFTTKTNQCLSCKQKKSRPSWSGLIYS
jgi:hypothetical protein